MATTQEKGLLHPENTSKVFTAFKHFTNFLANPKMFENIHINTLFENMRFRLIKNEVSVSSHQSDNFDFNSQTGKPVLLLPDNLRELMSNNLSRQIAEMIKLAVIVNRYYAGLLDDTVQSTDIIARIYQAEAAFILMQMRINLSPEMNQAIYDFPDGVAALSTDLRSLGAYPGN